LIESKIINIQNTNIKISYENKKIYIEYNLENEPSTKTLKSQILKDLNDNNIDANVEIIVNKIESFAIKSKYNIKIIITPKKGDIKQIYTYVQSNIDNIIFSNNYLTYIILSICIIILIIIIFNLSKFKIKSL